MTMPYRPNSSVSSCSLASCGKPPTNSFISSPIAAGPCFVFPLDRYTRTSRDFYVWVLFGTFPDFGDVNERRWHGAWYLERRAVWATMGLGPMAAPLIKFL